MSINFKTVVHSKLKLAPLPLEIEERINLTFIINDKSI